MPVVMAPVDPNVRLPAAVVAATARAMQMQEEQRREMAGETPPPSPNEEPSAPPPSQPSPQPPEAPDQLEHKLRSTEGRLAKAESERKALAARLAAIENQRPVQRQAAPQQDPPIQVKKLVTPEEEEEYGTDFLTVVAKKAREELAGEMFKLQRRMDQIQGNIGVVQQAVDTDAREKMKTELDQLLPQWREINYNDRYISWLALPDPFSGIIRHELLKAAYSANQTRRVLAFFSGFLAEEAAGIPPSPGTNGQTQPTPNGNGAAPPARIPLETLAAPGRASPAASQVPADRPIITRAQITQFYADVAAGKYRGREAEKLENDAAIVRAANENRIV